MSFNSFQYFLFFPVTVAVFFLLPQRIKWLWLLIASYYFYMAWNPIYITIMLASTVIDYYAALRITVTDRKFIKRFWITLSMCGNLGILAFFKYYNFFCDSLESALAAASINMRLPDSNLLLPVGISFYSFQTLSYTLDVYMGRQKCEKRFGLFALYVAFFPQLVAGPIERFSNLRPQLEAFKPFEYRRFVEGLKRLAWGLFKKIVIADRLAMLVDNVYNNPHDHSGPAFLLATVFFAFQIYCDFSGYTDMAIGSAQILGVDLMQNFRQPYLATSFQDFWRRWHISLSTWFRDYLYIPLGGNRVRVSRLYFNIMVVFLICGLWHGANWTFVAWGGVHGMLLFASNIATRYKIDPLAFLKPDRRPRLCNAIRISFTFSVVTLAWVFFRAQSITEAVYIFKQLPVGWSALADKTAFVEFYRGLGMLKHWIALCFITISLLMMYDRYAERGGDLWALVGAKKWWFRWSVYYALIISIVWFGVFGNSSFIYFQF